MAVGLSGLPNLAVGPGTQTHCVVAQVASSHCTAPVKPSTRTIAPSGIRVAPETLTTQGMPSSRATIEE